MKDRSKAQQGVVKTCLAMTRFEQATRFTEQISNWRRGACYADLAFALVEAGDVDDVRSHLQIAEQIAEHAEDWRRDRIRSKIARVHALLGQSEMADLFASGLIDAETGKTDAVRAAVLDEDTFESAIKNQQGVVATGNFDLIRNALDTYVALYGRFFNDDYRRNRVWEELQSGWEHIPYSVRVEVIVELTDIALRNGGKTQALELVELGEQTIDERNWEPAYRMQLSAQFIERRFLAGDTETAKSDLAALLKFYEQARDRMINIDRAEALLPSAEATFVMHGRDAALALYRKTLDESVVNPNSRPRAEDLSKICLSLAQRDVEPDAALWREIQSIRKGLSAPW